MFIHPYIIEENYDVHALPPGLRWASMKKDKGSKGDVVTSEPEFPILREMILRVQAALNGMSS